MVNRLAREASPYLQQHAKNPVDWYPWGAEALERAQREDRPILLSIGYSACHWCHVMERESFEDDAVAALMNQWFINIKVDREERPDLDQVYQLVVQLMGRSGGWPLTVFLTPDQKPFFGGTYFPPADRYGMPGFPKVLQAIWEAYHSKRDEVNAQSAELVKAITDVASGEAREATGSLSAALVTSATRKLAARFDDEHGGFGHKPKFPSTMSLDVLLRGGEGPRTQKALEAMRAGGIWDQLGGGFHRYSTDERWLVPHFEKMLYDNALLLRLYVDGWRAFGDRRHASTARDLAAYVLREMVSPEGGFYATQDADSEGEEGRFFVWTPAQVDEACAGDAEAARVAKRVWDVTDEGNFEESGATVLSLVDEPNDATEAAALERARRAMFDVRERRPKPFRDEKVLASWNALMIGAMADAGAALDPALVAAAVRAMGFVERALVVPEGEGRTRVLRLAKDGVAKGKGFLDDHAYLADAALDLYEATGDPRWVTLARSLGEALLAHFYDTPDGGFFFVPDDGDAILVRAKDPYDHAVPSGASVACRALLRLGALVDVKFHEPAARAVEQLAASAEANPGGMSNTVCLVDRLVRGTVDVVLVGPRGAAATQALARQVFRAYLPDRVVAWVDPADPRSVEACVLLAEGKPAHAEPVAYVCRGRTCSLPMKDPAELAKALRSDSETPRA
ncbi:MAG TPA: thioredoxin domain-containing protein [Polyangiaceae bacterium]